MISTRFRISIRSLMIFMAISHTLACKANSAVKVAPTGVRPFREPREHNFIDGTWCKTLSASAESEEFQYATPHCFSFSYMDKEENLFIDISYMPEEPRFWLREAKCLDLMTCYVKDSRGREVRIKFNNSENLEIIQSWRGPPNGKPPTGLREGDQYRAIVWRYRPSKQ